jgi:hypothetical protein
MKTTSIWFPKHGDSMEFYVEYESTLNKKFVEIHSIKLHGIEMFEYFNESAIDEFEELLVEKLK